MQAHAALPPPLMPYGAPDLKRAGRAYLARAVAASSAGWGTFFLLLLAASTLLWRESQPPRRVKIIPYVEITPPPVLREIVPPPAAPTPVAPPARPGIAVPVPDEQVSPTQTIAAQPEMNRAPGTGESSGQSTEIAPPAPAAAQEPDPNAPVYIEQLPEASIRVEPEYPQIAKEAGVQGTVVVRVLVGIDGHVQRAFVAPQFSILLLDSAAVQAARRWVFTPALANNRPVAVWVAIPMRFQLH